MTGAFRPQRHVLLALSATLAWSLTGCSALTPNTDDGEPSHRTTTPAEDAPVEDVSVPTSVPLAELEAPLWGRLALDLAPIAELTEPVAMSARSGSLDLYVAERAGVIRLVQRSFNQRGTERITLSSRAVLDISETVATDGERGLLGLTFSTDGRYLYVSYSDLNGDSVIAEYDIGRSTTADVDSRREILRVPQPFANHNGGHLAMGPDGYLYIGLGDGGSSNDPEGHGQNASTLLGSILRIDVDTGDDSAYAIPSNNPFADGTEGAPETWLIGVRNPWRFSFDTLTDDLWIADVGQDTVEEINRLRASGDAGGSGANLGWAGLEGFQVTDNEPVAAGTTPPIYAYDHEDGRCSVTGGYVYRGELMPLLDGVYIFGDYCTGELLGLHEVEGQIQVFPLTVEAPGGQLVSFGEGNDGELYVVLSGGQLVRIEPREVEADS